MANRVPTSGRLLARLRNNLLPNGDFGSAPTFVAPTTANGVFIDGTASGSFTNNTYIWRSNINANSMAFQFDTSVQFNGMNSLKVSNTDTTGNGYATTGTGPSLLPVQPSTQYVFSAYAKTDNVPTNGVGAFIAFFDKNGSFVDGSFTNFLSGTNDFTLITTTFTTPSNVIKAEVQLLNFVSGNICTAWFSNASLWYVSAPPRVPATNRNLI